MFELVRKSWSNWSNRVKDEDKLFSNYFLKNILYGFNKYISRTIGETDECSIRKMLF